MLQSISSIEKAVFINNPSQLKQQHDGAHLYIGDEFCDRRLPSVAQLEEIFFHTDCNQKKVSIVTSYLTNKGIEELLHILDWICTRMIQCEIVINDWAVLGMMKKYNRNFELIAGRLLVSRYFSKLHSYLQVEEFSKNQTKKDLYCLFPSSFLDFLKKYNIFRLEFNSSSHLILTKKQLTERGFKSHIYFPFMYLTTSRYCTCPSGYNSYLDKPTELCNKECDRSLAMMKNKYFASDIIVKGNSYFIRNTEKEDKVSAVADRIINNDFMQTS